MMIVIDNNEEFLRALREVGKIRQCTIRHTFLSEERISGVVFKGVTIKNCIFKDVIFDQCVFRFVKFDQCDFDNVTFVDTINDHTTYKYCRMYYCLFKRTTFQDTNGFIFCDMTQLNHLDKRFFEKCNFEQGLLIQQSTLPGPYITRSQEDLKKIRFDQCDTHKLVHPLLSIGPIGSRKGYTTYIPHIDWVNCGCWTDEKDNPDPKIFYGGHLDAFEKRVKETYPEGQYHDEYMAAIQLFKVHRDQYYKKEKKDE